jgi:hypothetical protein
VAVVAILLPSILAAEVGGQNRFELEAVTVGDALRALPVANMLFDERGELRRVIASTSASTPDIPAQRRRRRRCVSRAARRCARSFQAVAGD